MVKNVKLISYVVLALIGLWCGAGFYRSFTASATKASQRVTESDATNSNAVMPAQHAQAKTGAMTYAFGLLAVVIGIALLAAYDFSRFFGEKFEEFIMDEQGEGNRDPEYEEAEKVWANGNHLEAIQLMRDYLKVHPLEQYVALRIAEIYEKDLGNYLAAALEYEEVLKKRLPAERWGWAAVHLANLYSGKLNRPDDAAALLRRIVSQYPSTGAAKKARERLGEAAPAEGQFLSAAEPEAGKEAERGHNLPKGFRPK